MAKKFFTNESLATFIDEIKAYIVNALSSKSDSIHTHQISDIPNLQATLDSKANAATAVYIDENDNETVIISGDIAEIAELIGGDA